LLFRKQDRTLHLECQDPSTSLRQDVNTSPDHDHQHYTIERRYRDLAARSGVGSVVYGIGERARGRVWCYEYSTFTVVM